jgi:hypothetical protein
VGLATLEVASSWSLVTIASSKGVFVVKTD